MSYLGVLLDKLSNIVQGCRQLLHESVRSFSYQWLVGSMASGMRKRQAHSACTLSGENLETWVIIKGAVHYYFHCF